jgi:diguanylate cyclase (GGDEF)-like protein
MIRVHPPRATGHGLGRLLQRRPPMVWAAALVYVCRGAMCFAALAFPVSANQPVRLDLVMGVLAVLGGVALWMLARNPPAMLMQGLMALSAVTASVVVAQARTGAGAMLVAFAYPWSMMYVAHFFSRRALIVQGMLVSASFAVGLLASGLSDMGIVWLVVVGTAWSTGLVLGNLSESLRRRADTDPLTGLLNRGGFLALAARERAIADRTRTPLTVAVLDLNGFKEINDRLGHAAGDRVLAELARQWRARLRAGDILARHGGDEFVLLLPATAPGEAGGVLERLRFDDLPVDWSVGISGWLQGEDLDACLARADRSLYSVKQARVAAPASAVDGRRMPSLVAST